MVLTSLSFTVDRAITIAKIFVPGRARSSNVETVEGTFGFFLCAFKPTLVAHLKLQNVQCTRRHCCGYQLMPTPLITIRCAGKDVVLIYCTPFLISVRSQIKHRGC